MKVLVTGSSGFLGSVFLDFLKKKNISYIKYDRSNPKKLASGFDSVVNFGGFTPYSNVKDGALSPEIFHSANVDGTKLLLKTIIKNKNLKRFINIGSSAEYGFSKRLFREGAEKKPKGPYGKSKLEQSILVEKFAKEKRVKVINLCLFNVAGLPKRIKSKEGLVNNPSVFESLINQFVINFNGRIIISNKNDIRDYVDIGDIMEAILRALKTKKGKMYEMINICSGKGTKLEDVVNLFGKVLNKEYKIYPLNVKEASCSVGVNDKARRILNWKPKISLEESVRKMIW